MKKSILIEHRRAPGDVVVLSAFVRDLKRSQPDTEIGVATTADELWQGNPYISPKMDASQPGIRKVYLNYSSLITESRTGKKQHFLSAFHKSYEKVTGECVLLTEAKPDLHLNSGEIAIRPIPHRYWLILSGNKQHLTTKQWHVDRYQAVVNTLLNKGIRCVQVGGGDEPYVAHVHPRLDNVLDLVGKTSLRKLMQLVYHADGVICPITMAMHMAAAFERPCVVLAGGREEPWWEAYDPAHGVLPDTLRMPHVFLSTVGKLNCCGASGCWRRSILPKPGVQYHDLHRDVCSHPLEVLPLPVPRCLDMISADQVVNGVMSYYERGLLPALEE